MFKLTVVIPTYNRKESILHVLELLKTQEIKDIDLSIIVVVDGSTDGTREAIKSHFPEVTIIEGDGNWWWTRSVNEGCKRAVKNGADAVLLLNDDTRFDHNYLETLVKSAKTQPRAIIGSLNLTEEKEKRIYFSGAVKFQWWWGKLQGYHPFLSPYHHKLTGLHKSIVLPGRGVLIPAEVFQAIGYFDERALPQYKADYEFTLRANRRHIQTLISWDAVIFVNVKATGKGSTFIRQGFCTFLTSLFKKNSRTNLYRNFLYYKHFYPAWARPLFPLTALMVLIRQLVLFIKGRKY
ncbi:MAG: glycosyltransferase family 2 protein [Candidatus Aminicenantes bacterium]|nr:MAG: glycosyltransferase family 2 protein [Candidatus Aminicenantes bacterium]